ncbi:MAG: SIMPL domain-containing protein [Clostridiales bacterium]|nr:SIMPL domain-containing protein [Clostridiales bacterium]
MSKQINYYSMTLIGRGVITASPDLAVIRLGVQTEGSNLIEIQAENSEKSQAVLQELSKMGITNIKTFQYNINRLYDFENGNRIDKGYSVVNIFEIRTKDINRIGLIIDNAVKAGANVVDFITFELSDSELYYNQALNLAVDNARQKAKSISSNLGRLYKPIPINIIENSSPPQPLMDLQRVVSETPVIPGNIKIEAVLTIEYIF